MVSKELETWIANQHPRTVKGVTAGKPVSLYHLSPCSTIKKFSPRLPQSCKHNEDTTVPRICGAEDLDGCFAGIPHELKHPVVPATSLTLYKFPVYETIIPNKNLTGVNITLGEQWLVPHRLSIWDVTPERVATFRLEETRKGTVDGEECNEVVTYIGKVYGDVIADGKLLPEYCRVVFNTKNNLLSVERSPLNAVEIFEMAALQHVTVY